MKCCNVVPKKISLSHKEECGSPLTIDDLKKALSCMENEKSIGLDGFVYEFYKELWDVVGPYLLYVYRDALSIGSLGEILNKGNIKLIPKLRIP